MELHEELLEVAKRLSVAVERWSGDEIQTVIANLREAAERVGKAWSGSWLGYHANVYYEGLEAPPPGAHFSLDWGFMRGISTNHTSGAWEELDPGGVETTIYAAGGSPDLSPLEDLSANVTSAFKDCKPEVMSILVIALSGKDDSFLASLLDEVKKLDIYSLESIVQSMRPTRVASRDSLAAGEGLKTPPHIAVQARLLALEQPIFACNQLAERSRKARSHMLRGTDSIVRSDPHGAKVFIGHGRAPLWRELKDFIDGRLGLPWDEFNRVPQAGVTNVSRLSEMLDSACMALLILTGEDEQADATLHARMNVVHEAGLFQGRLGFTRAIVLLEEGCEEFGNIHGLGQIRFAKGNISSCFEEVRRVLEREGVVRPQM